MRTMYNTTSVLHSLCRAKGNWEVTQVITVGKQAYMKDTSMKSTISRAFLMNWCMVKATGSKRQYITLI